jgi:hypothetical protein
MTKNGGQKSRDTIPLMGTFGGLRKLSFFLFLTHFLDLNFGINFSFIWDVRQNSSLKTKII